MTQPMSDMLQLVVEVLTGLVAMQVGSIVSQRQAEAYRTFGSDSHQVEPAVSQRQADEAYRTFVAAFLFS